jgi:predicted NAD-dependent protein-ADP-ribosyltransferase YbiA (DUF1768 family)
MPSAITSFSGKHAFLGMFYFNAIFYFDGDPYRSAEAAFRASKILPRHERISFTGWGCKPWEVHKRARYILPCFLRKDWEQDVQMLEVQRAKFANQDLQIKLLETGAAELINSNLCHDNYWGVCNCHSVAAEKRKYGLGRNCSGFGDNRLGRILMQVRTECALGLIRSPFASDQESPTVAAA